MRELNTHEMSVAWDRCFGLRHDRARDIHESTPCPTCRAAVVRLVDGASAEPWPGSDEMTPDEFGREVLDRLASAASRNTWEPYDVLGFIARWRDKEFPITHAQQAQERK